MKKKVRIIDYILEYIRLKLDYTKNEFKFNFALFSIV